MQDHVTLLPPDAHSTGARGLSSTLPPDLLEQVRGRLRLLTLLLLIGFAFDLSGRLAEIHGTDAWTEARARDWWSRHQPMRV